MKTHKDLEIWKLSIALVVKVYKITAEFPKDEIYGLVAQMRRCSVSISSNIAEGAARSSVKEYIRFVYISLGSLSELETQCIISQELGFLNQSEILNDIELLRKKTLNFIKYLKGLE